MTDGSYLVPRAFRVAVREELNIPKRATRWQSGAVLKLFPADAWYKTPPFAVRMKALVRSAIEYLKRRGE